MRRYVTSEHWDAWNSSLRDMLVDSQSKDGTTSGSWDPLSPKDKWGKSGGRHYVTCLNLLMLEVYYRHLPLYIDLFKKEADRVGMDWRLLASIGYQESLWNPAARSPTGAP